MKNGLRSYTIGHPRSTIQQAIGVVVKPKRKRSKLSKYSKHKQSQSHLDNFTKLQTGLNHNTMSNCEFAVEGLQQYRPDNDEYSDHDDDELERSAGRRLNPQKKLIDMPHKDQRSNFDNRIRTSYDQHRLDAFQEDTARQTNPIDLTDSVVLKQFASTQHRVFQQVDRQRGETELDDAAKKALPRKLEEALHFKVKSQATSPHSPRRAKVGATQISSTLVGSESHKTHSTLKKNIKPYET